MGAAVQQGEAAADRPAAGAIADGSNAGPSGTAGAPAPAGTRQKPAAQRTRQEETLDLTMSQLTEPPSQAVPASQPPGGTQLQTQTQGPSQSQPAMGVLPKGTIPLMINPEQIYRNKVRWRPMPDALSPRGCADTRAHDTNRRARTAHSQITTCCRPRLGLVQDARCLNLMPLRLLLLLMLLFFVLIGWTQMLVELPAGGTKDEVRAATDLSGDAGAVGRIIVLQAAGGAGPAEPGACLEPCRNWKGAVQLG